MRNIKVVLELEKVIPLNVKEGEDPELKASRMIDEMIEIDKKNDGYLSSFEVYESEFEWIDGENYEYDTFSEAQPVLYYIF